MEPDDRQTQIIRVASLHFARDGYDASSMSAIATDAGVTRALVYHYFPGKLALLEAVLHVESEALLTTTQFDPQRTALENIRTAILAYWEHFSPRQGRSIHLHLQAERTPDLVSSRIQMNHALLSERIIQVLQLPNEPYIRAAVSAWLDFVTTFTKNLAEQPQTTPDSVIDTCIHVLITATGAHIEGISPLPTQQNYS